MPAKTDRISKFREIYNQVLLLGLCAFIISCPFSKRISRVTLFFSLGLWACMGILNLKNISKFRISDFLAKTYKPIFLFFAAAVISALFSLHLYHSQKLIFNRYLIYLLVFFMGSALMKDKRSILFLIGSIILSSLIIGVGSVWDKISLNPEVLASSFHTNIIMTNFIVLYMPLLFSFAIFGKNKALRLSGIIGVILLFVPLVFVLSRITWLACVFSLLFISCLKNRRALIIMLIVLLAIGFLMPDKIKTRGTTIVNVPTLVRVQLWDRGMMMFKSSPISGVGAGMFGKLMYEPEYQLSLDRPIVHEHAHNTFIEILAEMGLLGFISFIYIFVAFFIIFSRFINKNLDAFSKAILFGITGSIIANLILALGSTIIVVDLQDAAMFWLLFGMSLGLIREKSIEIVKS